MRPLLKGPVRLSRKGERTRLAILSRAKIVFRESGYTRARMSDIASRTGISLGAVYRYFADKDDLFSELFEELHAQFLEATRSQVQPRTMSQMRESIRIANEHYFTLYSREREFMRAIVEASAVSEQYMARWSAMHDEIASRALRRLRPLVPEPSGRALEAKVFALVCMAEQVAYVNFSRYNSSPQLDALDLAELVTGIWWGTLTGRDANDDSSGGGESGAVIGEGSFNADPT
jgi:AcrR family transcriptional regulator